MRHFTVGPVVLHHQSQGQVVPDQLPVNLADVMQRMNTSADSSQPRHTIVKDGEVDASCYGTLDKVHGQSLVQPSSDALRSATTIL